MFLAPLACNGMNSTAGCKDCTITMADADLVARAEGKLDDAGLHGWQAEDQGQHDAGPEVAVHFGGC